ncbi:hypothetical protein BJ508DRAFT_331539 [Ascobolus immersus RN42]|uniref:Uncharacterized protein n=1 Tax=Ascobolus immersus RN42 TaxID=1160509 RepID=A0A3N4HW15_ASCIM|nr:hypothetical protein BJ508DRAFT_331539 [Ascobolus immersus RN42]
MSASLAPECSPAKEKYDNCFIKWYSDKFLKGDSTTDDCKPLFDEYRKCLQIALKEKGLDKMLDEARRNAEERELRKEQGKH